MPARMTAQTTMLSTKNPFRICLPLHLARLDTHVSK
jgi:hypothetical protein